MSSCNNNSNITRIYLSQPCAPCNPCTSCTRCACDCTCESPTYETAGCLSIVPSACVKYDGPPLPDQGIATNDTLTSVIENLAAAITPPEPVMMLTGAFAPVQESENLSKLDKKIVSLSKKVTKGGLVSDLRIAKTDLISGTVTNNEVAINLDVDTLLEKFIELIKTSPVNTAKFGQLLNFMSDTTNFVLPPFDVKVTVNGNALFIQWDAVANAASYSVFYKTVSDQSYIKSGNTPALGLTLLDLSPKTEYAVYVVANSQEGKQSAPSSIAIVKTQ